MPQKSSNKKNSSKQKKPSFNNLRKRRKNFVWSQKQILAASDIFVCCQFLDPPLSGKIISRKKERFWLKMEKKNEKVKAKKTDRLEERKFELNTAEGNHHGLCNPLKTFGEKYYDTKSCHFC